MNIVYDNEFFSEEVKNEYLNQHKKGTRAILERLFKISAASENDLKKDIYDFTREELRKLFFTFMPTTENSSKSTVLYISRYIDWAIEEGYATGMNPLDGTDVQWKKQFAAKAERFWTKQELKKVLDKLVNAQDALVLYAPFIGILGTENAEITNLKPSHIDSERLVAKVIDADGSQREVEIDEEFVRLVRQAANQDEYLKSNGNPSEDIKNEAAKLIENDFAIRSALTRVKHTEEADKNIVYRRYAVIKRQFDIPNLTPTLIAYSGMLAIAKEYYVEGKLSEGYKKIASQFNVSENTLSRYKDEFLNEDQIKSVYKIS